ncbi:hypothetical protein BDW72DRAFT_185010 [Aspergillus terricola var. indicus]
MHFLDCFFRIFPMREGTAVLLYLAWILRPKMPVVLNHFPGRLGVPTLTCEWRNVRFCMRTASRALSFNSTEPRNCGMASVRSLLIPIWEYHPCLC